MSRRVHDRGPQALLLGSTSAHFDGDLADRGVVDCSDSGPRLGGGGAAVDYTHSTHPDLTHVQPSPPGRQKQPLPVKVAHNNDCLRVCSKMPRTQHGGPSLASTQPFSQVPLGSYVDPLPAAATSRQSTDLPGSWALRVQCQVAI